MLTLAFAQIVWSIVYQWDAVTGGSNGILGLWPSRWLSSPVAYYYVTLVFAVLGVWLLRRMLFAPLGHAMRASRDSALRAEAIGIDVQAHPVDRVRDRVDSLRTRRLALCVFEGQRFRRK